MLLNNIIRLQARLPARNLLPIRTASNFVMTPVKDYTGNKEFWSKNKESRPLSPFHIYKPQITSTLSILHRITGVGASAVLYAAGISALFYDGQSFPEVVQLIHNTAPYSLIAGTKAAVGGSLIYHTLNGVRHLIWDVGYGFQLKQLYLSGYVVVALSAIGTILIFIKG